MKPILTATPLLLVAALNAQMPEVVIRATTRLVQVNVIVTKNGEPVRGLKKEDFQVFDNGKRQEIRQFSEDTRAVLPSAAEPLPPGTFTNQLETRSGTPGAVTAILLDGVNTGFATQTYARQQVLAFLRQIQPEDRIALYTLDSHGLKVLHDYTTDSADLVAKLAKYQGDILPDVTGASDINTMLGSRGSGGGGMERAYFLNNRILTTLKAIEFIANNLAPLPGRKNLIWVSSAFPLQIGFGTNGSGGRSGSGSSGNMYSAASNGRPSSSGGLSQTRSIPKPHDQQTWTADADNTIRALNNANLAIYPVDARGLTLSKSFVRQSTMIELASRTGGRAFYNSNDITDAIRSAVADSAVTYTLGFYPQNDKFNNSFHELKVKLADFPHAELRYRRGYLDQSAPPQDEKQRRAQLADSVWSPMDANGMGLRAEVRQTSAGLDITLRVDPGSVLFDPQGDRWAAKVDLLFVQKDAHGNQISGIDDTISMDLQRAHYDKIQREGLIYHKVVAPAAGASQLRVIARDASTGAVGSVSAPLSEVPAQP
ncbi:MAG: VWA domain-containing protein [Bryobacteraceae bacterium]|jgi:VWFA-related protein